MTNKKIFHESRTKDNDELYQRYGNRTGAFKYGDSWKIVCFWS